MTAERVADLESRVAFLERALGLVVLEVPAWVVAAKVYTAAEIAREAGLSTTAVYKAMDDGRLASVEGAWTRSATGASVALWLMRRGQRRPSRKPTRAGR